MSEESSLYYLKTSQPLIAEVAYTAMTFVTHLQTLMNAVMGPTSVIIMLTALTQREATLALAKLVTMGTESPAQVSFSHMM